MDTKKVLYFLEILASNITGYSAEIARLYTKALNENEDINILKQYLADYNFYGAIGENIYTESKEKIQKVYESPNSALEILPEIKQGSERINTKIDLGQKVLRSPYPSMEIISVIKKNDVISYYEAYKVIASTCVYLSCLYDGIDSVKYFSWNDSVGIQEIVYLVNTKFIPLLWGINRPNESWVIRKKKLGGRALFGGDAFYLSYENTRRVEVLCSALNKEPMGTHAYLNIDAYESNENDVPFCWGTGNLLSFLPNEALYYLQKKIVTKAKSPSIGVLELKMPTPMECIKKLTDGSPFCISPEELTRIMNQWITGTEIENRKRSHNCLFCNKYIKGNKLVCDNHFTTELR